jgi:hypothetical protein
MPKQSKPELKSELRRSIKETEYVMSCMYNQVDPKEEITKYGYDVDEALLAMNMSQLDDRRTTLNVSLDKAKRE